MKDINVDVAIIGAGPAGLSAAIYAHRANKKVVIINGTLPSALLWADKIDNYVGVGSVSGENLLSDMQKQVKDFGIEIIDADALDLSFSYNPKMINTTQGLVMATAVIIATGKGKKQDKIKGEDDYLGKGLSYCAVCDGAFYKNSKVVVVGSDHTLDEIEHLVDQKCDITFVSKESFVSDEIRALVSEVYKDAEIKAVLGKDKAEKMVVVVNGEEIEIGAKGFFIFGGVPASEYLKNTGIEMLGNNIVVDSDMKSSIEGVFAAGDVTGGLMQVSVAVAEGALAALSSVKYIKSIS